MLESFNFVNLSLIFCLFVSSSLYLSLAILCFELILIAMKQVATRLKEAQVQIQSVRKRGRRVREREREETFDRPGMRRVELGKSNDNCRLRGWTKSTVEIQLLNSFS